MPRSSASTHVHIHAYKMPHTLHTQCHRGPYTHTHTHTHARTRARTHTQEDLAEAKRLSVISKREYNSVVAQYGSPVMGTLKAMGYTLANGVVFLAVFNGVRALTDSKVWLLCVCDCVCVRDSK